MFLCAVSRQSTRCGGVQRISGRSLGRLVQQLSSQVKDAENRKMFVDTMVCVEGAMHLHYAHIETAVQALYDPFEPVSAFSNTPPIFPSFSSLTHSLNQALINRLAPEQKPQNAPHHKQQETKLVNALTYLASRAGFDCVSGEDEKIAMSFSFLLTTSVDVDWRLFEPVFQNNKNICNIDPPSFANKVLLFKRGQGEVQQQGYFIAEKLDELTRRTVAIVHQKLPRRLTLRQSGGSSLRQINFSLHTFFQQIKLVDSSFKDVVAVYSPKGTVHFNLKHFRDVPRSDLELVFPSDCLRVMLRPTDFAMFSLMTLGGAGVTLPLLINGVGLNTASIVALSAFSAYFLRLLLKYRRSKELAKSFATQYLSDNCIGSNRSVLNTLLQLAKQQDFTCAALICTILFEKTSVGGVGCEIGELKMKASEICTRLQLTDQILVDDVRFNNALHWLQQCHLVKIDPTTNTCHIPHLPTPIVNTTTPQTTSSSAISGNFEHGDVNSNNSVQSRLQKYLFEAAVNPAQAVKALRCGF